MALIRRVEAYGADTTLILPDIVAGVPGGPDQVNLYRWGLADIKTRMAWDASKE